MTGTGFMVAAENMKRKSNNPKESGIALSNPKKNAKVFRTPPGLATGAGEFIATVMRQAVAAHGTCTVALAGGNTPRAAYETLAGGDHRKSMPWPQVHFFWGDERMVPPDHELSNFRMAQEALLQHVSVPPENIHRIKGELAPENAAQDYRAELQRFFEPRAALSASRFPIFDLILLGLGEDGHTASIFPGTHAVWENSRTAIAVFVPHLNQWRVTLTLPVLNQSRQVAYLISGKAKAQIVAAILKSEHDRVPWPAARVRPAHGELHWLLDAEAASLLP